MDTIDSLLQKTQQYLRSAALLLETGDFDSCASRAYFAMFYTAQAALQQSGQEPSPPQGIRSAFVEQYVHSGRFPERAGQTLHHGYELQQLGDYAPHRAVSQPDAERLLQEAEAFVNSVAHAIEHSAGA